MNWQRQTSRCLADLKKAVCRNDEPIDFIVWANVNVNVFLYNGHCQVLQFQRYSGAKATATLTYGYIYINVETSILKSWLCLIINTAEYSNLIMDQCWFEFNNFAVNSVSSLDLTHNGFFISIILRNSNNIIWHRWKLMLTLSKYLFR